MLTHLYLIICLIFHVLCNTLLIISYLRLYFLDLRFQTLSFIFYDFDVYNVIRSSDNIVSFPVVSL